MKVLIAIESCHKNRHAHEELRNTWVSHMDFADVRFFLGNPPIDIMAKDEVYLDVPDDYEGLCYKTFRIIQYADNCGYDYIFKCDTDTFVVPERLKTCGFENHDYMGLSLKGHKYSGNLPYAHGGAGYFLSRRAIKAIIDVGEQEFCRIDRTSGDLFEIPEGTIRPEDSAVGEFLGLAGISLHNDIRFSGETNRYPAQNNDIITTHHVAPNQLKAYYTYFYNNIEGPIHISRGVLIEPGKKYVVRDKNVFELKDGKIVQ